MEIFAQNVSLRLELNSARRGGNLFFIVMTTDFQVTGDHDCVSGFVDVWVGGDGGDWSCSDSTLFRIPKELFDYHLLIGQLNTKHDLELLVESTRREMQLGLRDIDEEFTNVYVSHDGNWAGLPPRQYRIPVDVFRYLQVDKRAKAIGRITSEADVEILVRQTREEIDEETRCDGIDRGSCKRCGKRRILSNDALCSVCSIFSYMNTETKLCGHTCTISSVKDGCCACLDLREVLQDNTYPLYIDGQGWVSSCYRIVCCCSNSFIIACTITSLCSIYRSQVDTASRGIGYCPHCKY